MNATKCVVLLLIGIVISNVSARQLQELSKETKLSISVPKTSTKGLEDGLSVVVVTDAIADGYSYSNAASGPRSVNSYGSGYSVTNGGVIADGDDADASSTSGASGSGNSNAAAGPTTAVGYGNGNGGAASNSDGSTGGTD